MTENDYDRQVRRVRAVALVLLAVSFLAFVKANDAEATAIFDARGDAGMWALGIVVAAVLLFPGTVLLVVSLATRPRTDGGSAVAMIAGFAVLAPTALLAASVYPPDRRTDEGRPLDPAQWDHVHDLYLLSLILMSAAGVLVMVSAFPWLARWRTGSTHSMSS